ncbi:MAG: ABC transporter ATP-binding protein [Bacilli bacterium]
MNVLEVRQLTKTIKKKNIVENLSFSVKQGEVFGFLGPNGAGKTTTIRMLVGLIAPTEGSVHIAGYNVKTEFTEAMRAVGSIVENPELYGYLTGWENLKQFARMLGNVDDARIQEVVEIVHLEHRIHEKVKTYSLGMKQRLGIAQALLGRPKLLILDEPTNGLDPAGIRELRQFIATLVENENLSVFISSHLLSEVQLLCDRVAIIHSGKLVTICGVDDLINERKERHVLRTCDNEVAKSVIEQLGTTWHVVVKEDDLHIEGENVQIQTVITALIQANIDVYSVIPVKITLEDLFIELTGGEI